MAQLPLYYKNSKPTGPSGSTGGKKWKENYLFLLILVAFIILVVGNLWFVPSIEQEEGYEKVYNEFNPTVITNSYVMPSEPTLLPLSLKEQSQTPQDTVETVSPSSNIAANEKNQEESISPESEDDLERGAAERKEPNPKLGIPGESKNGNGKAIIADENATPKMPVNEDVDAETEAAAVDEVNENRRQKVIQMAKDAWDAYVQYAWGDNELKPISKKGHTPIIFGRMTNLGATVVDSLDTLYIMGLMEEFEKGKHWVHLSLNFDQVQGDVSVFEVNIRFVGGLLSAYALSGDELLKEKAVQIANKLLPAFNTPSGIPKSLINVQTNAIKNWGWASGGSSVLAEFGSLHLEFQYLTQITGNPIYLEKVQHVRQKLKDMTKTDGLYPNFLNPTSGSWGTRHISVGALGDSFYEYLLKSWLVTSKDDTEARDMYYEAMEAVDKHLVKSTSTGLIYVTDLRNGRPDGKMQHLACFSGGMFALGAAHATNDRSEHFMEVGKGIANTCHESYQRTATKLGPESFRFDAAGKMSSRANEKMYLLRPETVESYFVLWRLTHDQKYRDWGWEVVEALEQHSKCSQSGGYSGIKDVYNAASAKDDVMQSFFIAETLKYLFLLFSDDSVISLDSWVFNTEAHPLPHIPQVPRMTKT